MNETFYIAHPIDQAGEWQFNGLRQRIRQALERHGCWGYWPRSAWQGQPNPGLTVKNTIAAVNREAADRCSAMIAVLPDAVPTLGVPAEIERAITAGKPVGIIAGGEMSQTVQVTDWALRGAEVIVLWNTAGLDDVVRELKMRKSAGAEGVLKFAAVDDALEKGMRLPTRAYDGDAGFDLYVSEDRKIPIGATIDVPTNVAVEMPPGYWAMMVARSSTVKRGLVINTAIIDGGYRGELFASVRNVGEAVADVRKGERLAQLIPMRLEAAGLVPVFVDLLGPSDRGGAGWGSSGK